MATRKAKPSERAIRRDRAIEEHRDVILTYAESIDKLVKKLNEVRHNKWDRIPADLDILQSYVVELEMATTETQRRQFSKRLHEYLRELSDKYPHFPPDGELFHDLFMASLAWDNVLEWLEIESERLDRWLESSANSLKIPYDKTEPLSVRKQKIDDARERIRKARL